MGFFLLIIGSQYTPSDGAVKAEDAVAKMAMVGKYDGRGDS